MTPHPNHAPCGSCGRGRDIEWSAERDQLIAAIVSMQAHLEPPKKGAWNDHRGYYYADLADVWDACRKPLADAQLAVLQVTDWGPAGLELVTTLAHVSGQWIRSRLPVLSTQDPQAMGSALTYARKYGLLTIVGLAPDGDDDDGQAAVRGPGPQQRPAHHRRATGRPTNREGHGRGAQAKPSAADANRKPPPSKKPEGQPAPAGSQPKVNLARWEEAIQAAGTRADLHRLAKEVARAFPADHQARAILDSALRARADALGITRRQDAGVDARKGER